MGKLGLTELLIIFGILVFLFGATKLPQLGSSLGSAIRNFKKGFAGGEAPSEQPGAPEKGMAALSESGTAESKEAGQKVASKNT